MFPQTPKDTSETGSPRQQPDNPRRSYALFACRRQAFEDLALPGRAGLSLPGRATFVFAATELATGAHIHCLQVHSLQAQAQFATGAALAIGASMVNPIAPSSK